MITRSNLMEGWPEAAEGDGFTTEEQRAQRVMEEGMVGMK
jgi:hypothetical protein